MDEDAVDLPELQGEIQCKVKRLFAAEIVDGADSGSVIRASPAYIDVADPRKLLGGDNLEFGPE